MINLNRDRKGIEGFLVDLHIHSHYSPDSSFLIEEILMEASGLLNAITITDHDFIGEYSAAELAGLSEKYEVKVFTHSVEISSTEGDILAYGLSAVPSKQLEPEQIIEIIHSEGGAAVAAHPFTILGVGELVYDLNFDAIEINGSRSKLANQEAKEAANTMGLPCIGGSDAHIIGQVGTCVTKFDAEINSIDDIIEQIKKGNCSPVFLR